MTSTEIKFHRWANKTYPDSFIHKLPDFKQTGNKRSSGLPDYMIVHEGNTEWWEVKSTPGDTITISHFTPGQLMTFPKFFKNHVKINVYIFHKSGKTVIDCEELFNNKKMKLVTKEVKQPVSFSQKR